MAVHRAGQEHRSSPNVLDRRRLATDHRALAAILRPGIDVLDVGCGTGTITIGIADAVAPGQVVGIDRDADLIARASAGPGDRTNLRFVVGDAVSMQFDAVFDIVTAARTLQWIADPVAAASRMAAAMRPDGSVILLDYDHTAIEWQPRPPSSVTEFYATFLAWRQSLGFDNAIAGRLPALLAGAGLTDVQTSVQDEHVERHQPGFEAALAIWQSVMADIGPHIVAAGMLRASVLARASAAYREWAQAGAQSQRLVLRAAIGRRPA